MLEQVAKQRIEIDKVEHPNVGRVGVEGLDMGGNAPPLALLTCRPQSLGHPIRFSR